jgi:hypothetical protein
MYDFIQHYYYILKDELGLFKNQNNYLSNK